MNMIISERYLTTFASIDYLACYVRWKFVIIMLGIYVSFMQYTRAHLQALLERFQQAVYIECISVSLCVGRWVGRGNTHHTCVDAGWGMCPLLDAK